jgi:hypothetical protein
VALVAEFWKAMGESGVQQVASEEEGGDDKTAEDAYRSLVQLFQAQVRTTPHTLVVRVTRLTRER